MAKKKHNDPGAQPGFPAQPTEDLTGAFPTEGFGGQGGMTGDLGLPTEGFSGAHGVPTEGFPGGAKMPTGAHGWTEGMSGDHGILPTEGFPGAAPPRPAARPGGRELEELDDVLVLLPEEDEAPTKRHSGDVIRDPIGADVTIRATGNHFPQSEGRTASEEVRLLAQHPDHGILPVEDYTAMRAVEELPDIEDVEDITSLVEEAVSTEIPAPRADFEDEYVVAPHVARRRGGFSSLVRVAAAAAVIVAGALYGPGLYEQYTTDGTNPVAGTQGPSGGSGTAGTGGGTGVVTTTVQNVPTGEPAVRFRGWVDGVLAAHFGTSVPTER